MQNILELPKYLFSRARRIGGKEGRGEGEERNEWN